MYKNRMPTREQAGTSRYKQVRAGTSRDKQGQAGTRKKDEDKLSDCRARRKVEEMLKKTSTKRSKTRARERQETEFL